MCSQQRYINGAERDRKSEKKKDRPRLKQTKAGSRYLL